MTTAQLWVKYHQSPPQPAPKAPIEQTNSSVVVLEYVQWLHNRCACCHSQGATGIWRCEFTASVKPLLLCAACGMYAAYAKWNGFYSAKLVKVDLLVTLTFQSRS